MGRTMNSLQQITGKTIQSIVVCRNADVAPESQLFLVFKDGTSFEVWVDQNQFSFASQVDDEDLNRVLELANQREGTKVHVFESPLASLGNERVEREPEAAENNPLDGIDFADLDEEHTLFLAVHRRDALLLRLALPMSREDAQGWTNLFSAAFGSLMQRYSFDDMYDAGGQSTWHDVVRPPSVLPAELLQFLGGLSIVNNDVYFRLSRRATVDGFLRYFRPPRQDDDLDRGSFAVGERRGQELLDLAMEG